MARQLRPTYSRTLDAATREAFLSRVCARNMAIDVTIVERRSLGNMKSRFLRGPEHEGGTILIEAPTIAGSAVPLHKDESVEVVAVVEGERYGFRAGVLSRTRAHLGGNVEVPALRIEAPATVSLMQRRKYFRARVPALEPIMVQCIGKAPATGGNGGKDELVKFDTRATDISGGGLCLKLSKEREYFARAGVRLALSFSLRGATGIQLVGEVRHAHQVSEKKDWIAGVMFLDAEKTVAGRQAVDAIMRYVTKRQREVLKKKSGLE